MSELQGMALYGRCSTCGLDLPTPTSASQHGADTMAPVENEGGILARGHSWTVLNPTRAQRVRSEVGMVLDHALEAACDDLERLVERGTLTQEEILSALGGYPDFSDAYEDWIAESEDE